MTKTEAQIQALEAICAGAWNVDTAIEGLRLRSSIEKSWLADYHPSGHPGTLPITYGVYRRAYDDRVRAGDALRTRIDAAFASYSAWQAAELRRREAVGG